MKPQSILITESDAIEILVTLEEVVIGLAQIGAYYEEGVADRNEVLVSRFIKQKKIAPRLAKIRRMLSDALEIQGNDSTIEAMHNALRDVPDWNDR